jgi:CheY-like chemotaxis protein
MSIVSMLHDSGVEVAAVDSLALSIDRLRKQNVSVVICDRDLPTGGWKAILAAIDAMPAAPLLVVTAPDADDKLWAEVLNLGGYDVLAQPLDVTEVQRVLLHAHHAHANCRPRGLAAEKETA